MKKFKLTLLEDGDIEIVDEGGTRIYHRSYNPGDNLKKNLIDAYEFLQEAKNPGFNRAAYEREQRQRDHYRNMMTFSRMIDFVLRKQKRKDQPIYAIVGWWCSTFNGLEQFTSDGECDLPELRKIFEEKYEWKPGHIGITEQSYTIVRIDVRTIRNNSD